MFLAEPVLVGRKQELEELQRCLNSAVEGKGTTVFVSGEAGSGKTRLVTEFLNGLEEKDAAVLSGYCLANVTIPYFPFIEAFNSYFSVNAFEQRPPASKAQVSCADQVEDEELDVRVWLRGPTRAYENRRMGTPSPENWKNMTFATVAQALIAISKMKPAVLLLDDIHWADSASLSLLHYLSRAIRSSRSLILATFRSEELNTDEEGHPHPLTEVTRLMRREYLLQEIKLSNLTPSEVTAMAEKIVGGSIHSELAKKLSLESQGNPLFVVEWMRMLFENCSLAKENGQWRFSVDELQIPGRIRDVILRRLGMLKPLQRRILDLASVLGDKFDADLLSAVLGVESLEVLEALNDIAKDSCLVLCDGNLFRFDHSKSREIIFAELSNPLKRGYHAKIAEKLEAKSKSSGELPFGDLAYHYAEAGNSAKAVEYSLVAGEDALARFGNNEAIKHFSYVLQNASESQENAGKKKTALEGLGDAYYVIGRFSKAIETFEQLAKTATGKMKLRAYRKAMDAVFFGPFDLKHQLELAKQAEPYAAFDRLESARIRFHKAGDLSVTKSGASKSREEFEAVLQVFEEEYSLSDIARGLEVLALFESLFFLEEKGLSHALLSMAIFEEQKDLRSLVRAGQMAMHNAFMSFGLYEESKDLCAKVIEISKKIGSYSHAGLASLFLGRILDIFYRRPKEALKYALKALEYFEKTDATREYIRIYSDLLRLYVKLGNKELAEEYHLKITEFLSKPLSSPDPNPLYAKRDIALALAVFSAAKGFWKEANQHFDEGFKYTKEIGMKTLEVGMKAEYAWALERQGKNKAAESQRLEVQKFLKEVDERFSHVRLTPYLLAPRKVVVDEEFEVRLNLVNLSRKQALLVKVDKLWLPEFKMTSPRTDCAVEDKSLDSKNKAIGPFNVETIKLRLKAPRPGVYTLNPEVIYTDEANRTQTCKANSVTIKAQTSAPRFETLPGRISTGIGKLDALLFGGIPENYAVVLTGPPGDERAYVIKSFLETGIKDDEVVFYVTAEADGLEDFLENSNFHLFLCNPKPKTQIPDLPNVYKLRSKTDLTNLNISLVKAYRSIDPSKKKRVCVETVSNILLNYEAKETCKWISELTTDLSSKGFTILSVLDPSMHPPDQANAVINSFDGEISIAQTEDPEECRKSLRVKRLKNQEYLKNSACLTT